ncbi:MAG: sigma-54-dependent Fis family transcriptional regulator [Desulfuromonadales bacterium]|nr:sigma-54-dependent Fis family transcriptional regulator [Desulfuromonadales bacterium]
MSINRILVADDEESMRWVLAKALEKKGFSVDLAANGDQAQNLFDRNEYDLAILDIKMPGTTGLELLQRFRELRPDKLVIIMTAESSMENAVTAMKLGAYDYITKPFDLNALDAIILKAQKALDITTEVHQLKTELQEPYRLHRAIIGSSAAMQQVYKIVGKTAASDVTVLITGESGTGKELIARALHYNSRRLGKPFVAINCAAIPRELLESELFGHEKGAFTGATERRFGKFEQAKGGTLFLDEIGDMPLELQTKLLRVLQEKEITRTGGNTTIQVDVRIIAATNQNIAEKIKLNEFREDLFYRLNVVPIVLPPLRERMEDIHDLTHFFINKANEELGVKIQGCCEETMNLLRSYHWPGNIRELENTLYRATLLASDKILAPTDFPDLVPRSTVSEKGASLEDLITGKLNASLAQMDINELDDLYDMVLQQMERPLIKIILLKTRNNQVRAAEILGINRNTLRKKIQTLGIEIKKG